MRLFSRPLFFLALLVCFSLAPASQAQTPNLHGAYRFQRAHWIYVHLAGDPHQIGFEHGYLLAPEIVDAMRAVKLDNTHGTGLKWQFFRATAQNVYWPHIEAQYREELQGIDGGLKAHGARNIDLWDVVALNAFLETPAYYVPWLQAQHHKKLQASLKAPGDCSAFVATGDWTADHKPVIAHSMWYPFMAGERWNIIFDIAPQHGYHILMDGFPGKIIARLRQLMSGSNRMESRFRWLLGLQPALLKPDLLA